MEHLRMIQVSLGITNEYKYYILIAGLFGPERNIIKFWSQHEDQFIQLVK
jgi:hypothetical protein